MDSPSSKPLQFNGTAGGVFVAWLVYALYSIIPIVGWALGINYFGRWMADNSAVNGKKVEFTATMGDTFWFFFKNALLVMITLGIYVFWYIPKAYRFVADHIEFVTAEAAK